MQRSAPVYRGSYDRGQVVVRGGVLPRGGYYYRPYYPSYYSYRPYYTFRPRFSLGIGLWLGYPISWSAYGYGYPYYDGYYPPYYYGYPSYGYPAPSYPPYYNNYPSSNYPSSSYPSSNYPTSSGYGSTYPQQSGGSIAVQPGTPQQASGGVTFEITPSKASVFVDGTFMGTGDEFGPTMQPLGLSIGRHRIEIRADGYRTMSFDADVTAGQIMPFRAALQR